MSFLIMITDDEGDVVFELSVDKLTEDQLMAISNACIVLDPADGSSLVAGSDETDAWAAIGRRNPTNDSPLKCATCGEPIGHTGARWIHDTGSAVRNSELNTAHSAGRGDSPAELIEEMKQAARDLGAHFVGDEEKPLLEDTGPDHWKLAGSWKLTQAKKDPHYAYVNHETIEAMTVAELQQAMVAGGPAAANDYAALVLSVRRFPYGCSCGERFATLDGREDHVEHANVLADLKPDELYREAFHGKP